jgi:hypothetical protein
MKPLPKPHQHTVNLMPQDPATWYPLTWERYSMNMYIIGWTRLLVAVSDFTQLLPWTIWIKRLSFDFNIMYIIMIGSIPLNSTYLAVERQKMGSLPLTLVLLVSLIYILIESLTYWLITVFSSNHPYPKFWLKPSISWNIIILNMVYRYQGWGTSACIVLLFWLNPMEH